MAHAPHRFPYLHTHQQPNLALLAALPTRPIGPAPWPAAFRASARSHSPARRSSCRYRTTESIRGQRQRFHAGGQSWPRRRRRRRHRSAYAGHSRLCASPAACPSGSFLSASTPRRHAAPRAGAPGQRSAPLGACTAAGGHAGAPVCRHLPAGAALQPARDPSAPRTHGRRRAAGGRAAGGVAAAAGPRPHRRHAGARPPGQAGPLPSPGRDGGGAALSRADLRPGVGGAAAGGRPHAPPLQVVRRHVQRQVQSHLPQVPQDRRQHAGAAGRRGAGGKVGWGTRGAGGRGGNGGHAAAAQL